LPTLEELRAISAAVRTPNRIAYYGFGSGYYWTTTYYSYGGGYCVVRVSDGSESGGVDSSMNGVRCVRR
jgi:hypothetical protein